MVEGYRERIFKDGGGKVAFFELEDLTGRVNVKVRGQDIETYAHVLTGGEPVLVAGKVSFPQQGRGRGRDEPEGPREPTILLNEVKLLSAAVKEGTRSVLLRVREGRARPQDLTELAKVLRAQKGDCPVTMHVQLTDGRCAVLALGKEFRVEVGDALLAGIEKVFGEEVAELR